MKKFTLLLVGLLFLSKLFSQNATDTLFDRGYLVKIGDVAPNITIEYLDGKKISLSELKGRVVLLQFTASWCGPCRREMPHLEKEIWQPYKDKGLFFAGIDLKESPEKVRQFADTIKITYPLTLDIDGSKFYSFAVQGAGVTRNILIDKNGKIVFLTRLYDDNEFNALKEKVKELMEKG